MGFSFDIYFFKEKKGDFIRSYLRNTMEDNGNAISITNRADYYPFEGSTLRKCPEDIFSTEPVGAEGNVPNQWILIIN